MGKGSLGRRGGKEGRGGRMTQWTLWYCEVHSSSFVSVSYQVCTGYNGGIQTSYHSNFINSSFCVTLALFARYYPFNPSGLCVFIESYFDVLNQSIISFQGIPTQGGEIVGVHVSCVVGFCLRSDDFRFIIQIQIPFYIRIYIVSFPTGFFEQSPPHTHIHYI